MVDSPTSSVSTELEFGDIILGVYPELEGMLSKFSESDAAQLALHKARLSQLIPHMSDAEQVRREAGGGRREAGGGRRV